MYAKIVFTPYPNLLDASSANRKFIVIDAYIRKGENLKINIMSFQLRKLEKVEKFNPK